MRRPCAPACLTDFPLLLLPQAPASVLVSPCWFAGLVADALAGAPDGGMLAAYSSGSSSSSSGPSLPPAAHVFDASLSSYIDSPVAVALQPPQPASNNTQAAAAPAPSTSGGAYGPVGQRAYLVLLYRRDVLSGLGIAPPNTWLELLLAAAAVQQSGRPTSATQQQQQQVQALCLDHLWAGGEACEGRAHLLMGITAQTLQVRGRAPHAALSYVCLQPFSNPLGFKGHAITTML